MIIKKLRDHASAQCCVRHYENGDLCLQSYHTDVIYYDQSQNVLYCTGTYSQTTRTHISWFLREYFPSISYNTMREAYLHDYKVSAKYATTHLALSESELHLMEEAHNGRTLSPDCFKEVV